MSAFESVDDVPGDGNRVKATLNGVTTAYLGNYYEQSGSAYKKYYYAGGTRIAMSDNGIVKYLLGDHLGSTSLVANSSGGLSAEQRYKPWGEQRYPGGASTLPTRYQFTGQRNDVEIGLYFYNARFYSSYLNRWLSPDTIVPDPANPQSLNRYSYTYNNPVKYTDPTGHDVDCGLGESGCKRPVKKKVTPPPVITYIYNEMMTNVRGDVAQLIAKLNAQCFACMWSDTPLWWPGAAKGLSDAYMADAAAKADATAVFGWMVRTDGDWDHKKRIRNMEQAAGRDPDYQQVGDWAYRWDTWSNIHFGYIGAAAGFPINSLLDGAGTEQWWTDTFLGRPTTEAPGISGERRFDEPWDQAAIQIGIDLWNTYGLAVKPEHVVYAVQNMPGLLKRPAQGGQP